MSKEYEFNEDDITVTVSLDDCDVECGIFTILTVDNMDYIALFPLVEDEDSEYYGEVWFYRYFEPEDETIDPTLENIEDEDEYEAVLDAFEEFIDAAEFDEIMSDDEEADEDI